MNVIIKSGRFIDGVEVTSEHIGKKLKVIKSDDHRWLPVDFISTIRAVSSDNIIDLHDTGGGDSHYAIDLNYGSWEFKWVNRPKPKKSSAKQQRQKLAKSIREAKSALALLVSEAEEIGMVVSISEDDIKITFNPPREEY